MSTTPEVTVARHSGLKCLGLSLITNKCVVEYDSGEPPNHEDVLMIGKKRTEDMKRLVSTIVDMIEFKQ